jgi:hypothetical protein
MELETEFYLIENWCNALESVCARHFVCDLRSYDHSVLRSKV